MKKFILMSVAGLVLAAGFGSTAKADDHRGNWNHHPSNHYSTGYSHNYYRPYVRPYYAPVYRPYTPYVYNDYYTPAPYCGTGAYVGGPGFSVGLWR